MNQLMVPFCAGLKVTAMVQLEFPAKLDPQPLVTPAVAAKSELAP